MHAPFYPNTDSLVPSSATNSVISHLEKHPLSLSDVDRINITQQFIRKINHSRLGARGSRVAGAVFSQTIDFNKFEDDMNGTRLEQLTQILPQHANQTARNLAAINVLIMRKGKYGNYLAINFNFDQWGQSLCNASPCNDPAILLDNIHQPYLDQAPLEAEPKQEKEQKQQDKLEDKLIEASINNTETAPMLQNMPQADAEIARLNDLITQLLDSMTLLTGKVTQLETQWNDLLNNDHALTAVQEKQPKTTQDDAQITEQGAEQEAEQEPEPDEKTAITINPVNDKSAVKTIDDSIDPMNSTLATPMPEADTALKENITTEISTEITTDTRKTALQFPPQFDAEDCQKMEKMLQKAGDKAQLLLDMLRNRLSNTANPVRDPFAYLGGLLRRLEENRLDMSIPTISATCYDPTLPKPVSALKQCEDDFREAVADYTQMEKNIKLIAAQDELSFQECIRKPSMKDMWKTTKDRVMQAKQALTSLQTTDAVFA